MAEHETLLTGVWETGIASTSLAPALLPRVRKEYDFLKPITVHSDCTKRELMKFVTDGRTWTSKTISEIERKEKGIVYAALRTVIDAGWTEFLDRHPNIQNLTYEEIVDLMLKHFLEKNPLVSQRIKAMKITKSKEESISDLMHRIYDSYISAELDKCPVETFVLLHLLTLLPSDPLSEKVKNWLVEAMRVEPNIKSLEKASAYIQKQESDSIASKGA